MDRASTWRRSVGLLAVAGLCACGGGGGATPGTAAGSECSQQNPLRSPFFGDLHVHTRYSLDANLSGTSLGPIDAYAFARGEPVTITGQRRVELARPLDFAAVTDHADLLGEVEICTDSAHPQYDSTGCQLYRDDPATARNAFHAQLGTEPTPTPEPDGPLRVARLGFCGEDGQTCIDAALSPWQDIQAAAAAANGAPPTCDFTSFVAYEWSATPGDANLHRNVIFASAAAPVLPHAYHEQPTPEMLWDALERDCTVAAGCEFLTIPHNSNLSAGLMFEAQPFGDEPYTLALAQRRAAMEPLVEIVQTKGQSECFAGPLQSDEACDFEVWPDGGGQEESPLLASFVREALKEGLSLHRELGANPLKYGFVGGTDTHIATPGLASEQRYPGHLTTNATFVGLTDTPWANPGGLTVLWAEENTRESLFAAMRRREAYATSGTRPIVRFFGGWSLSADACAGDFAALGYATGVPMGGDLPAAPAPSSRPRFAVSALRDAGTANDPAEPLQRIQIVKGWVDAAGVKHEQVVDVAGGDNGASVNPLTCSTSGPGSASLCAVWEDTAFDPAQHAFWYARVLENPGCRWTARQCRAAGVNCADPLTIGEGLEDCCNSDVPKTVQERAWTSPIWYDPP